MSLTLEHIIEELNRLEEQGRQLALNAAGLKRQLLQFPAEAPPKGIEPVYLSKEVRRLRARVFAKVSKNYSPIKNKSHDQAKQRN
jgi:hypothetical protein